MPGTFLAYVFNVHGIKVLGASIAGAYIYLQPVFAVVLATIFLKEEFETYKLISAVLIFGGVYLVNKKVNNDWRCSKINEFLTGQCHWKSEKRTNIYPKNLY